MSDQNAAPRLVSRAEASAHPGAPQERLRLVGVPPLRRGARGNYLRHPPSALPREPVLVGPRPEAAPVAVVPPSREIRLLCCEGPCSPGLQVFSSEQDRLLAVGYCRQSTREAESAVLRHTPHYFVRISRMAATNFHTWACTVCGNERIYGAEEA
jgi:hypothetical protein